MSAQLSVTHAREQRLKGPEIRVALELVVRKPDSEPIVYVLGGGGGVGVDEEVVNRRARKKRQFFTPNGVRRTNVRSVFLKLGKEALGHLCAVHGVLMLVLDDLDDFRLCIVRIVAVLASKRAAPLP